jgi:hypothetical protein
MPTVSSSAPCGRPAPASWARSSTIWRRTWPREVRTGLRCGANYGRPASRARSGRCIAGRASGAPRRETTPGEWRTSEPARGSDAAPALPPPRQLAWPLVRAPIALEADGAAAMLARRSTAIARGAGRAADHVTAAGRVAELDARPADARACGVGAVAPFAAGPGGRRREGCDRHPPEQRTGRGAEHPARAAEASGVRPRQLRSAPTAHSPRGMIHAKCGRAAMPGQGQADEVGTGCETKRLSQPTGAVVPVTPVVPGLALIGFAADDL